MSETHLNAIGQEIRVGSVVTHTTASQYAKISIGFVRDFGKVSIGWSGDELVQVKVTWVRYRSSTKPVKTAVAAATVTVIDPATIPQDLYESILQAATEAGIDIEY